MNLNSEFATLNHEELKTQKGMRVVRFGGKGDRLYLGVQSIGVCTSPPLFQAEITKTCAVLNVCKLVMQRSLFPTLSLVYKALSLYPSYFIYSRY